MALFRAGNDEAFRVIHDRYRQRLFAYTRQMLPGLAPGRRGRAAGRVRARLSAGCAPTTASSRCGPGSTASPTTAASTSCAGPRRRARGDGARPPAATDPIAEAEQRESLRRLIADVRRLPEQQRSALLMRELGGMSYAELAAALGVSVPAVKSLLVRARVGLAQARRRATPPARRSARS